MRARSVVLLLLLATCAPPEFSNPLSAASASVVDKALLGKWIDTGKDGAAILLEVVAKDRNVMRFVVEGKDMTFDGHVTNVGKAKVLNLRLVEGDGSGDGYLFARYEFNPAGLLKLSLMRDDAFHKAVKSGALKGHSGGGGLGTIVITDTTEKVLAFVKTQPVDTLWEPLATFRRATTP